MADGATGTQNAGTGSMQEEKTDAQEWRGKEKYTLDDESVKTGYETPSLITGDVGAAGVIVDTGASNMGDSKASIST